MTTQTLPKLLTYTGIIPFVVPALLIVTHQPIGLSIQVWQLLFLSYSAIILSFLGGIHWGTTLTTNIKPNTLYITSNIASLGAWLSLILNSQLLSAFLLLFGFMMQLIIDLLVLPRTTYPNWFIQVRIRATVFVCIAHCLFIYGVAL